MWSLGCLVNLVIGILSWGVGSGLDVGSVEVFCVCWLEVVAVFGCCGVGYICGRLCLWVC